MPTLRSFYTSQVGGSPSRSRSGGLTVDFFRRVVTLRSSKNGEARDMPFAAGDDLDALLRRRRDYNDGSDPRRRSSAVFHFDGHGVLYSFYKAWRRVCGALGLDCTPHDFRRTVARDLADGGCDPSTIMSVVGWKSMAMLHRYRIINLKDRLQARARLDTLRAERARRAQDPAKVVEFSEAGS